jgi:hypothetical protein
MTALLPALRPGIEMPTVAWFAGLPPVWPESIDLGIDRLIARIHPRHVRDRGDELVLARALAYSKVAGLRRLTIRSHNLDPGVAEDCGYLTPETAAATAALYRDVLLAICRLPVIELAE